uniref:Uncharacterized protein n=1 Tax=Rhizophora mucronata TaxID=61149 RepID=A0A2P2PVX5_RHIMU
MNPESKSAESKKSSPYFDYC